MEYMKNYWDAIVNANNGPDALYNLNKLLNPYASHIQYDNMPVIEGYINYTNSHRDTLNDACKGNVDRHLKEIHDALKSACCKEQIYKLQVVEEESYNTTVKRLDIENNVYPRTAIRATFILATLGSVLRGKTGKWYLPLYVLPVINGLISWREFGSNCNRCNDSIANIVQASSNIQSNIAFGKK